MYAEEILSLMIGIGVLAAALGYLADAWFHPDRFRWLQLPGARPSFAKPAPPSRRAA